jgi:8-oxo-dGTP pyrophosphatase MutT (NUDIX family)
LERNGFTEGWIEKGEIEDTAMREVEEETGVNQLVN